MKFLQMSFVFFSSKLSAIFTTIFTSSFSYFCLINYVTKFISAVIFSSKSSAAFISTILISSLISYFTIKNFHYMFYTKLKSANLFSIQQSLCFARFFDIRLRQTHITLYFKSKIALISIKKYAHSRFENQST